MYRHDAFLGQESVWAAEATECAADQQRFWAAHDQLFELQADQRNVGKFSKASLETVAVSLGLNTTSFDRCLESDRYAGFVQQASSAAQQRGVRQTPTLFVGGRQINMPASFDELVSLLTASNGT